MRGMLGAALVVALSLLAAGCGGSSRNGGAAVAAPPSRAVAFARCMRANGIPNWPDPTASGDFDKAKLRALSISGIRIRAIQDGPCRRLVPTGPGGPQLSAQQVRTQIADWLSFSRCMRRHGLTRFPDPTSQGHLTVAMVTAQGIDVHSPQVLRVVQACLPASHGLLTPAKVREALSNTGH